jgi:hypothetical protein
MSDPTSGGAPGQALVPVCRLLRTKTAFGTTDGDHDWRSQGGSTAAYWCLGTMQSAGPDDDLAQPHACREGRACFQAPT